MRLLFFADSFELFTLLIIPLVFLHRLLFLGGKCAFCLDRIEHVAAQKRAADDTNMFVRCVKDGGLFLFCIAFLFFSFFSVIRVLVGDFPLGETRVVGHVCEGSIDRI